MLVILLRLRPGQQMDLIIIACCIKLNLRLAYAYNFASPCLFALELGQTKEPPQQIRNFGHSFIRQQKTGHTKLPIWGNSSPEVGDVDGDKG